jgi:DNA recombination protein RmuC
LIEEIILQSQNNALNTFSRYAEIEDWLREQWAGLFGDFLRRTRQSQQVASLSVQVSQASDELNKTFKPQLETSTKWREVWGEAALGNILEETLSPDQFARNIEVRPRSNQRVDFAIKLSGNGEAPLWLPIDAKYPAEDYERLHEAIERGDPLAAEAALRGIEARVRSAAKDIRTKYVAPPHTTEFAVMFLPTERLFAEVIRRPGLVDWLQRECRVMVAGPAALASLMTSVRIGFSALAIQQSSEVWRVLSAVKTDFEKFGDSLAKVHRKLEEAQRIVEEAGVRRRAIERKLRDVEVLREISETE